MNSSDLRAEPARRLITDFATNLYVIDLGGGLSAQEKARDVQPEEIASRPMKALWRGITHPDACRTRVAEVDLKGFASVMLNTLSDAARYGTPLGEKSYALISSEYMNFSSRLAYHFSTVDAYCSEVKNNNYVTFQFMGGGSSSERRSRRVRFIAGVLKNLDFEVEIKGDWLQARLMKYEGRDTEEKLDYLGRLMCCSRQLDAVMYSENIIDWYVQAFMKGNYTFERTPPQEGPAFSRLDVCGYCRPLEEGLLVTRPSPQYNCRPKDRPPRPPGRKKSRILPDWRGHSRKATQSPGSISPEVCPAQSRRALPFSIT